VPRGTHGGTIAHRACSPRRDHRRGRSLLHHHASISTNCTAREDQSTRRQARGVRASPTARQELVFWQGYVRKAWSCRWAVDRPRHSQRRQLEIYLNIVEWGPTAVGPKPVRRALQTAAALRLPKRRYWRRRCQPNPRDAAKPSRLRRLAVTYVGRMRREAGRPLRAFRIDRNIRSTCCCRIKYLSDAPQPL